MTGHVFRQGSFLPRLESSNKKSVSTTTSAIETLREVGSYILPMDTTKRVRATP